MVVGPPRDLPSDLDRDAAALDALLLLFTIDDSPTGREELIDLAELIVADG